MAVPAAPDTTTEVEDLRHSLRTANLELSLSQSKQAIESIVKDEEIRKLRLSQCLLQDQVNELHEQLDEEQARSDGLEDQLDQASLSLDQYKADTESAQQQIRTQARELANLRAELKALENATFDSDKILSEKLALTREISALKPEVEHLHAQVEANNGLLAEKLSLQRQLTAMQVELENERRTSARALAKQGKKQEQDEELRAEIEEVRKELTKEKKDRLKAESALAKTEKRIERIQAEMETQQQAAEQFQAKLEKATKKEADKATKLEAALDNELEELREQLQQEKAARKKAEKAAQAAGSHEAELEELRKELEQEKRARAKAEKANKKGDSQNDAQVDELRKELDEIRKERKASDKEYQKTVTEMQSRIAVLDDKLNAFRDKLRTTKDKLKQRDAELERLQNASTVSASIEGGGIAGKGAKKRMAAAFDPDCTNLGTPGDGFPAKRARMMKRATSVPPAADSNFSLTPLLNRTGSVAPVSPIREENEGSDAEPADQDAEATPTAPPKKGPKKTTKLNTKPLAPSASNKANAKPGRPKKAATSTLDGIAEEEPEASETATVTVPLKGADDAPSKAFTAKTKPRKSLLAYSTFTEEPAPEKKKKRKLGTGNTSALGKTLFDAEEDEQLPSVKGISGKGIFAARALGKISKRSSGMPISGGHNMLTEENFSFSPLKKERRQMSFMK